MTPFDCLRKFVTVGVGALLLGAAPSVTVAADTEPQEPDGKTLEASGSRTFMPFPFVFYSEETELGGGVAMNLITRPAGKPEDARPNGLGVFVLYTARDQYTVALESERYSFDERWYVSGRLGFLEFPTDDFGIGNSTDPDASETFTPRGWAVGFSAERELRRRLRTGPVVSYEWIDVIDREVGGRLETLRPTGYDGGERLSLGWALTRDGRDHAFYPRKGTHLRVEASLCHRGLLSDFDYTSQNVDFRYYHDLSGDPEHGPILALRGRAVHSAGGVPYGQLAVLGGPELLRGFYEGRFRDRHLLAAQAELRVGHWHRLGGVVFAEMGEVASSVSSFAVDGVHASYGVGVRWQLSAAEKVHVRADLGLDDEGGGGFYLNFLEAF